MLRGHLNPDTNCAHECVCELNSVLAEAAYGVRWLPLRFVTCADQKLPAEHGP